MMFYIETEPHSQTHTHTQREKKKMKIFLDKRRKLIIEIHIFNASRAAKDLGEREKKPKKQIKQEKIV